jgi:hypothetical protein
MIKIQYAQNGWLLTVSEEGEMDKLYVFSHGDSEQSEVEAFRDLLVAVHDAYGPSTSRYSDHRIYVRIEPGDKSPNHPDNMEEEVNQ